MIMSNHNPYDLRVKYTHFHILVMGRRLIVEHLRIQLVVYGPNNHPCVPKMNKKRF